MERLNLRSGVQSERCVLGALMPAAWAIGLRRVVILCDRERRLGALCRIGPAAGVGIDGVGGR